MGEKILHFSQRINLNGITNVPGECDMIGLSSSIPR